MKAEIVYEASDGQTRSCGIFEFDALPVAGDYVSVALEKNDPEARVWMVMERAYHIPRKRPDSGSPHTRILVRNVD